MSTKTSRSSRTRAPTSTPAPVCDNVTTGCRLPQPPARQRPNACGLQFIKLSPFYLMILDHDCCILYFMYSNPARKYRNTKNTKPSFTLSARDAAGPGVQDIIYHTVYQYVQTTFECKQRVVTRVKHSAAVLLRFRTAVGKTEHNFPASFSWTHFILGPKRTHTTNRHYVDNLVPRLPL